MNHILCAHVWEREREGGGWLSINRCPSCHKWLSNFPSCSMGNFQFPGKFLKPGQTRTVSYPTTGALASMLSDATTNYSRVLLSFSNFIKILLAQHCVSLKCAGCWFDTFMHHIIITTIVLADSSITSQLPCLFWGESIYIYGLLS